MTERNVRATVLGFLDNLPDNSTVQPIKLAEQMGLSAEQVNAYLESARQDGDNAEIVVTSDGSVRIHPRLKGQFQSNGDVPKKIPLPAKERGLGAFDVLKAAIEKVPAVKYALGVAGVAAALAIIRTLVTDLRIAFVGIIVMLVLMAILYIFAKLTSISPKDHASLRLALMTFMWFSLLITIATGSLLFTSVFFDWPLNLKQWITGPPPNSGSVTLPGVRNHLTMESPRAVALTTTPASTPRKERLDSSVETKPTARNGVRDSNDVERSFVAPAGWYIDKSSSEVTYSVREGSEAEGIIRYGREVATRDGQMVPTEIFLRAHARSNEGLGAREGRCTVAVTFVLRQLP